MIVPSIDLRHGRAVQLRRGREHALDGGDPFDRLEEFAVAGEVAIVDLDAAMGTGSNASVITELVARAPCRVGGGIRTLDAAMEWLDAGAAKVVIGTAATPEFCAALPRDRVVAAVDAERGEVVVEGWQTRTGRDVLGAVEQLAPHVGGFLLTQVEYEGMMGGFDRGLIERVAGAAGGARVTAAGGITTAAEVAELDAMGVDAQVGMALYTGKLPLADAVAAPLVEPAGGLWPTVVCDEEGRALGLVWSSRESLARAVSERRGVYWSRSRGALWAKGETSGNTQELLRVDLDCDRDALRFVVRQHGAGFCHRGTRTCWGDDFDLGALERLVAARAGDAAPGSGTAKLLGDPRLLRSKLLEEAGELADARSPAEATHEAADLLYFLLVALQARGGTLAHVRRELERRSRRVRRRPMAAKPEGES
jgi:phosphoribosyl-ATP pyrophosphohydrolase